MKYLIVDDEVAHLRRWTRPLREAGHHVTIAREVDIGWERIQRERKDPFDLVLLDLALDRRADEFTWEQGIVKEALSRRGFGDLPMSGQALGLRLWRRRRALKQRYCYVSNVRNLIWMPRLIADDPEFNEPDPDAYGLEMPDNLLGVILEKSELSSNNVAEKLQKAWQIWEDNGWLH
uniref:Response regulator receiver domain-containing protein n=1 Tax=Candidatus Kentrum sp. MB TaxID=2138164 RepID=A0A451B8Z8_9GAMM|nr:MAG: Response regulator receiver domain-containing protein [Candidatus Kentron sp. MB]VFK29354.1 MAG: Response regulator receiver domain-containing protein [Candidatus Kentron sp. MB]VFK74760.1 MAG: Response regulator receiver domain-containing protein [Candidatus Kentron sp. MB]